eukprot:222215_1
MSFQTSTSPSWKSKNIIDWTCDEVQEWITSTDIPSKNTKQIIRTIIKQNICGQDIYSTKSNSFHGINNRYATHLYNALQTIKEEHDEILPANFKRVNKKRGILQSNLPKSARDDGIEILTRNIAKLEGIQNKIGSGFIRVIDKTTANDLEHVTTQLKEITNNRDNETDADESKSSQLQPKSRALDKRSIVKCIGEVIIRPTKADTDAQQMGSGTGTAFRKLDHGYIAILTCAHNVIGDDGKPYYKIWFDPDPSNKEYTALICAAWYYPNDRYEMKYDVNQKHSEYDLAILICKDTNDWFESIDLNNEIHVADSNAKTIACEIFGYPVMPESKWVRGQMCGMSGDAEVNDPHTKYEYKIETWPGCSGAPIFASNVATHYENDADAHMRSTFTMTHNTRDQSKITIKDDKRLFSKELEKYLDDEKVDTNDHKPQHPSRCNIYGIHIYGDPEIQHNIGVKIDKNKIQWIDNHMEEVNRIIKRESARVKGDHPKQTERAIKVALKAWEFVSYWECDHCGYTNQRVMIGGVWKLYNQSHFCGLCSESKSYDNVSSRRVAWSSTDDTDDGSYEMKSDIFRNEMPKPPALKKQTSSYQAHYVPTESTRFNTRYAICELPAWHEKQYYDSDNQSTQMRHNNEYPVYGTGFSIQYHELEPRHSTLKEQILAHDISEQEWEKELKSLNNARAKIKHDGRACLTDKRYGIQIDDKIHIENRISIAIYCDLSQLCKKFRKSYRKRSNQDTDETIKKRHIDAFYWLGRFIKSAIEFWGDAIEKPGKKHGSFYVGFDTRCVFNQLSDIYHIPTSTTYSIGVACLFARNDTGIILELGPKFKHEIHVSKCITISDFMGSESYEKHRSGEKERLIAGTAILTIINIRDLDSRQDYRLIVEAILYFERITEQTFDRKAHYNYGQLSKKDQRLYLVPLLKYQLANYDEYPLDDCDVFLFYDRYICAIFKHFCEQQREIDLSCINDEFVEMGEYLRCILFEKISDREYKVDMNNLKYIFPNLERWGTPVENYINRDGVDILWIPSHLYAIENPWPGNGEELYASDDLIEFQWNKEMSNKRECDTQHTLYLLQLTLEKIRADTNARNEYFKQTKQTKRYIVHLDAPEIISSIWDWYHDDKENNKFDGDLVYKSSENEMYLIEKIDGICNVSLDIAAKILIKMKEICIAKEWTNHPQPILKLKTRAPKGIELK